MDDNKLYLKQKSHIFYCFRKSANDVTSTIKFKTVMTTFVEGKLSCLLKTKIFALSKQKS